MTPPTTPKSDEAFWDALERWEAPRRARAERTTFLRTRSLYAALMLAGDLTTCRALLHSRPVPIRRLDPRLVGELDLEPGSTVGLTANLVEQVLLHTPLPEAQRVRRAA